eukprot:1234770-Pyramimonas_sp.AAC.1
MGVALLPGHGPSSVRGRAGGPAAAALSLSPFVVGVIAVGMFVVVAVVIAVVVVGVARQFQVSPPR